MNTETKQAKPTLRDIITAGLRKIGREDVVAMLPARDEPGGEWVDARSPYPEHKGPAAALRAAFVWRETPQGRDFWRAIATDLENITVCGYTFNRGSCQHAGHSEHAGNWRDTLERRPVPKDAGWYRGDEYDSAPDGVKRIMERRALIEALRPLAKLDHHHEWTVAIAGVKLTAEDAQRARDLLRELGEWPGDMVESVLREPQGGAKAERTLVRIMGGADVHPRARCGECGGYGARWLTGLLSDRCDACHGTGRRHVNGKPFYAAEEVALYVRGVNP